MSDKSWLDSLSEILSKPLPGTEDKTPPPSDKPVVFNDDDDDDSLLDKITDILSRPLPGSDAQAADTKPGAAPTAPENPGETAVREAGQADARGTVFTIHLPLGAAQKKEKDEIEDGENIGFG